MKRTLLAFVLSATLLSQTPQRQLLVSHNIVSGGTTMTLYNTSVCGSTASGANCTIATTASGRGLVALVHSTSTLTSAADGGDTFTLFTGSTVTCQGFNNGIFYATSTGGARTTFSVTTAGNAWYAVVYEISAISATDQVGTTSSTGADVAGSSLTLTSSSQFIAAMAVVGGSVSGIFGGNAFTNDSTQNTSGWAHLVTSTTGPHQAQWSSTGSGANCTASGSFKP